VPDEVGSTTRVAGLLAAAALAAGCAAPVAGREPAPSGGPALSVRVVDHGWHTAIVVRREDVDPTIWPEVRDFPDAALVEVAWGDRDFYMAEKATGWLAVKAALFTSGSVLHVAGFAESALASLVSKINSSQQLNFRLQMDPAAADRLTPEQATHLVPFAQEAMSNSLRHSKAHVGTLSLQLQDGNVRLTVEDDGVGFDPSTIQGQGHGLNNMEKRARKLGGRFQVMSEPGRGTRIVCDLPQERIDATS